MLTCTLLQNDSEHCSRHVLAFLAHGARSRPSVAELQKSDMMMETVLPEGQESME